jgi:YD repeat-containing protein
MSRQSPAGPAAPTWKASPPGEQGRGIRGEGDQGVLDTGLRYDPAGRWTEVTDSRGNTTTYRLGDRRTERWEYDPEGNLAAYTDGAGRTSRTATPLAHIGPDGTRLTFGHDTELRLTTVVDQQGLSWRTRAVPPGRCRRVTDRSSRSARTRWARGDGPSGPATVSTPRWCIPLR